jgi:hypothetical protein
MHFRRLAAPVCYPVQTVQPGLSEGREDPCLDDNAASEFVSGTLAATAITQVEAHLASCRDCRALVAALAGSEADSQAATRQLEKVSEDSQVVRRPVLSIGDRVGRYLVLATLGSGGMGVVFTAYDPQLDRKIALKLLRGNLGVNAKEARARLKREAQAIAQLNHPNVVGVYDVGTTPDGDVYIAMEFVEGDTLTHWLKKWPRTWREILDVFQQAGRGLMAAHSVGLLHRDFKPDNVLVGGDGRVRVTDFGLARSLFLDDSARGAITNLADATKPRAGTPLQVDLTATGTVLGTPRYMPPEQLTGPSIDARADQFSFCVALYEALWGAHPLKGATSVCMLEEGARAQTPAEAKGVPSSLVRAVMRGLEKERQKRFPTMSALMHELTAPPSRSPVRYIAAAALGALAVTAATAAVITQRPRAAQRVEPVDERPIEVLFDEIRRKDQEIQSLREQLATRTRDLRELEEVKQKLDVAQREVKALTEDLVKLKAKQVPNAKPIIVAITNEQVTDAIQVVRGSIEFCLDDLDSRAVTMRSAGAPQNHEYEAHVRLSTTPAGTAFDVRTSGLDYSPGTRLCIEDALKRVGYPRGPESLDLRIALAWAAGELKMSAHVVGQREPTGSTLLDL